MQDSLDPFIGIVVPYINFFVFFGLAIYFFRNPVKSAAKKEREEFSRLLAEATEAKRNAEQKLQELQAQRASLDQEIKAMEERSHQAAAAEAERLLADGDRLAKHLEEEAERVAKAEVARTRSTLRDEIVRDVVRKVTDRLKDGLNDADHARLQRAQVDRLGGLDERA